MATPISVTVQGKSAFNFSKYTSNPISSATDTPLVGTAVFTEPGKYVASLTSDIEFAGKSLPLQQVLLFSTTEVCEDNVNPLKWYYVLNEGTDIVVEINGKKGAGVQNTVYVFLVDQVSVTDNTGSATVTFTKVPE